jgi:DNA-binding LacI/PurR family transcriptional regulator
MSAIGVITNDRRPIFQRDVIIGVQDAMQDEPYEVLVDSLAEDSVKPKPVSLPITELAGVIVIANALSHKELQDLYAIGKPLSLVSHQVPDLPIPSLGQNNSDGILKLVDFLVEECNRHKIVFIRGDMQQHDAIERDEFFQRGLMHHNIVIPEHHNLAGDFNPVHAALALDEFISQGESFDAILASDFLMGCSAIEILQARGIRVPEEVAVVGFGDGPVAADMGLTVVGVDVVEMGRRAARQLLSQIKGQAMSGVTWLNTELVRRSSAC